MFLNFLPTSVAINQLHIYKKKSFLWYPFFFVHTQIIYPSSDPLTDTAPPVFKSLRLIIWYDLKCTLPCAECNQYMTHHHRTCAAYLWRETFAQFVPFCARLLCCAFDAVLRLREKCSSKVYIYISKIDRDSLICFIYLM